MKRIQRFIVIAVCLTIGVAAQAKYISDSFPGTSLSTDWSFNHMGSCTGTVNSGLILNPKDGSSGWRQSAIVSTDPSYSWVTMGSLVQYTFTVSDWSLSSNNNVAARMYISTTDGQSSPNPWDDYNNSNGVMAELSLNSGHFYFNLFQKTNAAFTSYNNETYKLGFLDVGVGSIEGYTFGFDLSNTSARLWYSTGASTFSSSGMHVATGQFNQNTKVYVGVINGTGADLGPGETVTFSNVTVIPEPGVFVMLVGGLYLALRRRVLSYVDGRRK